MEMSQFFSDHFASWVGGHLRILFCLFSKGFPCPLVPSLSLTCCRYSLEILAESDVEGLCWVFFSALDDEALIGHRSARQFHLYHKERTHLRMEDLAMDEASSCKSSGLTISTAFRTRWAPDSISSAFTIIRPSTVLTSSHRNNALGLLMFMWTLSPRTDVSWSLHLEY